MVHLAQVPTDKEVAGPSVGSALGKLKQASIQEADTFSTSVYGSRYAGLDLPKHEMPEEEMPKEVAYRMIKCVQSTP
jgi:glutamate decarboxylase